MGIIAVRELFGLDGSFAKDQLTLERKYKRKFQVETDLARVDAIVIRQHPSIPAIGSFYAQGVSFDTGAFCQSVNCTQKDDNPFFWEVECEYSSRSISELLDANPLLRPLEISWSTEKITEAIDEDINGNPIANSAGTKFDPPIEITRRVLKITIKRNFIDPKEDHADYLDHVNEKAFLGYAAEMVLFDDFETHREFENGMFFFPRQYTFLVKTTGNVGWKRRPLDAGYYQIVGGQRVEIQSPATGQPVSEPWPLNGAGVALAVGAAPVYLTFTTSFSHDFNKFGIIA